MDTLNDLYRETEAVFKGSAVFVLTVVPVSNCKLVKQVALMDCVDFYAVNTGITEFLCRLAESFDHLVDFFDRHRTGIDTFYPAIRRLGS